jgi:hypothetical protein
MIVPILRYWVWSLAADLARHVTGDASRVWVWPSLMRSQPTRSASQCAHTCLSSNGAPAPSPCQLSQLLVDAGIASWIVRKHPYSLVPMLVVNWVGHNSYPGTGLKRCDGLDCAFLLG